MNSLFRALFFKSKSFYTSFGTFKVNRKRMKIPDRWLEYTALGNRINGTPFICFKTPLKYGFHKSPSQPEGLEVDEQFSPSMLLQMLEDRGYEINTVIDLTNTFRYYDGQREFGDYGIRYVKLKCVGHEVPSEDMYSTFCNIVSRSLSIIRRHQDGRVPSLIGVHCTHGVNRTGYLICRYLIENFGFQPNDAISSFNVARGHEIERGNYITDLLSRVNALRGGNINHSSERPLHNGHRSDSGLSYYESNSYDERPHDTCRGGDPALFHERSSYDERQPHDGYGRRSIYNNRQPYHDHWGDEGRPYSGNSSRSHWRETHNDHRVHSWGPYDRRRSSYDQRQPHNDHGDDSRWSYDRRTSYNRRHPDNGHRGYYDRP